MKTEADLSVRNLVDQLRAKRAEDEVPLTAEQIAAAWRLAEAKREDEGEDRLVGEDVEA